MYRAKEGDINNRSSSRYHAGLTADSIIDVAVECTHLDGLDSWSFRDLAKRLGVAPSALYHHIGGKDLVRRHVVERVLKMVDFPVEPMPWREWFRAALYPAHPVLSAYPGVARWLLLHGPMFESMVPVVDAGIASLQQAGFGKDTAKAYTALFNTAIMTIAAVDDRIQHEKESARYHSALISEFIAMADQSPGLSLLAKDVATQFVGSPESVAGARETFYRDTLELLMDGLEGALSQRS